jgi:hypothetical protein
MDRYRKSSPASFWEDFTDENGKRMSFTAISQALRNEREADVAALAEQARSMYSKERFAQLFSYSKGGERRVKTKDAEIAKTYQKLLDEGITQ